jgi:hypothetical protein
MISLELLRGDERGRASLAALCRARAKRGCRTTACCYSNTPRDAHASCRRSVGRERSAGAHLQGHRKKSDAIEIYSCSSWGQSSAVFVTQQDEATLGRNGCTSAWQAQSGARRQAATVSSQANGGGVVALVGPARGFAFGDSLLRTPAHHPPHPRSIDANARIQCQASTAQL